MLYQALKHQSIKLDPKSESVFDAGAGVVFVPQTGSKIYLHWLTDSGKLRQTYTMTYPTQVESRVKLINGLDKPAVVQVIHIA